MAVEVKNLRIKVNVNSQSDGTMPTKEKQWSQQQMMSVMQQLVKNQKER